jgi:hypothetical protein
MDYRLVRRTALTASKAFCTAFCARSALKLLNRLLSGQVPSSYDVLRICKDCLHLATFFAAYSAAYRVIARVLESIRKVQVGGNLRMWLLKWSWPRLHGRAWAHNRVISLAGTVYEFGCIYSKNDNKCTSRSGLWLIEYNKFIGYNN